MVHSFRARLDEFSRQKRVHANSLIISVFGDLVVPRGGRIWLGSLIRLLAPLGINERLVRTAVFRLAKDEWLETESLGRRSDYLLTASGQRRFDEASRHIYASHAPLWDRRWRLILCVKPLEQKDRERLRRALFWQGFGALGVPGSECYVHPGADLSAALDSLVAEGLGHLLAGLTPLLAEDTHPDGTASNADLVARAWNLNELGQAYAQFVAAYRPALAELQRDRNAVIDAEEALLMRLLLIHDYRRLLLRDPELPDPLIPFGWPGQAARILCRDLYRRLLPASECHLECCFQTADGNRPAISKHSPERFPEDDPLTAIAA